jgi:hypothetical protein
MNLTADAVKRDTMRTATYAARMLSTGGRFRQGALAQGSQKAIVPGCSEISIPRMISPRLKQWLKEEETKGDITGLLRSPFGSHHSHDSIISTKSDIPFQAMKRENDIVTPGETPSPSVRHRPVWSSTTELDRNT